MEDIDHRIGVELPQPASEILVQFQFTISLFITQIPFDIKNKIKFITCSEANNEATPIGMNTSPINVNIPMTWREKSEQMIKKIHLKV
jgi:hypothetical protein